MPWIVWVTVAILVEVLALGLVWCVVAAGHDSRTGTGNFRGLP